MVIVVNDRSTQIGTNLGNTLFLDTAVSFIALCTVQLIYDVC